MHCLFTDGCGAPTAAKPHHEEVTPVAVLRDESEIASSPTELVFSADPALPVAFLTFSRPNGGSDVLEFTSRPLGFRISQTYPYTVTDVAAGPGRSAQPGCKLHAVGVDVQGIPGEISPYSSTFEKIVKPVKAEDEDFVDDVSQYLSEKHFVQERQKFHMRSKYRLAYYFLSRFVRTIEVMTDGNLHYLHFCLPVTAMWYVYGEAKQNILDTVPFNSPDIKARYFIRMCFVEGAGHCKSLLFMSKRLTHKNHQPNPSYLFSYIRRVSISTASPS
ncbi:unnamed protein product [Symbiodinium natans]|uniref:Uncharacterized protein n=1 Tax=Symbiodinium natans TaxID=878477 RepID=A0A812MNK9_9DINO|nr:unnamed protein product [Symbiodinium natans]